MIKEYYHGDRKKAAAAAAITVAFLNNMVSQEREVMRLDNGDWVVVSKKYKIFKKIQNNG
jgi:hypothetical protein